jgi:hypothetical protein
VASVCGQALPLTGLAADLPLAGCRGWVPSKSCAISVQLSYEAVASLVSAPGAGCWADEAFVWPGRMICLFGPNR